jgi:uncharacterized protein YjeT (DUF2065 family)
MGLSPVVIPMAGRTLVPAFHHIPRNALKRRHHRFGLVARVVGASERYRFLALQLRDRANSSSIASRIIFIAS